TATAESIPTQTAQAKFLQTLDVRLALTYGTPRDDTVGENGIIGSIVEKGAIDFSRPVQAYLEDDGFTNHSYEFMGEANQRITIELTALSDNFDVKLALLGPDNKLVDENDDIDFRSNNLNS